MVVLGNGIYKITLGIVASWKRLGRIVGDQGLILATNVVVSIVFSAQVK